MKIELFARRNWLGQVRHFFRVRAGNGEPLLQSEGYHNRGDMLATVHLLRNGLANAEIIDA